MSHIHKFESSMFSYCSNQAERAYKLIEDGEVDIGLSKLGHLADVLQMLITSQSNGMTNIDKFALEVKELPDYDKEEVYTHLQEHGFGQHIAE